MRSLDNARKDGDAGERHRAAAELMEPLALDGSEASDRQADAYADGMQERRREHEACPIERAGAEPDHFRAVGVAMKDRKEPDNDHGNNDRRLEAEGDRGAEHNNGERDTELDERK